MKYTFGSGQRPLDGYTIKRGVGKGGFGEVYFAVSDGGKEVALKLVRGDGDVELRGIAHCLNLKHQNLVGLYDLRCDSEGRQWVVMEFISGDPLHKVLDKHEKGLPVELAKQWFLALARAVGYLHDHGIVHRDLKPANIFIEEGILKVGDYGLCKSMSNSARSAQTQSVGTVHYMAPEVSTGNYNKQIDIYACGILLYEMLTGNVPFDGESAGEILMKHLTAPPDLGQLPFEFVPIVSKALAKNPAQRYETMAQMAQAIEMLGSPPPPPMPRPTESASLPIVQPAMAPSTSSLPEVLPVIQSNRGRVGELSGSMALAAVLGLLTTTFWAALIRTGEWTWITSLYFTTVAVAWSVLVPAKFWPGRSGDTWGKRLTMMGLGAAIGLGAMWLDGFAPVGLTFSVDGVKHSAQEWSPNLPLPSYTKHAVGMTAGYMGYFALALGLMRWWKLADRRRKSWFSLFPVIGAGFWAFVLLFLWTWPVEVPYNALALMTASALVQWVSPWDQPAPALPRRLRLKYA